MFLFLILLLLVTEFLSFKILQNALTYIFQIYNPSYFLFLSYHFHITYTTTFKIQFTFQFLCYYFNISFDIPFLLLICLLFVAAHFYLLLLSNPIHLFYLLHNKHFIRHHISQNKVLIIPKSPSFLPWQTILHTQRPIPHL